MFSAHRNASTLLTSLQPPNVSQQAPRADFDDMLISGLRRLFGRPVVLLAIREQGLKPSPGDFLHSLHWATTSPTCSQAKLHVVRLSTSIASGSRWRKDRCQKLQATANPSLCDAHKTGPECGSFPAKAQPTQRIAEPKMKNLQRVGRLNSHLGFRGMIASFTRGELS